MEPNAEDETTLDETTRGPENCNPWTVVDVVFKHLVDNGFKPALGGQNPAAAAEQLLRALGVVPSAAPDAQALRRRDDELAELRKKFLPPV